MLLVSIHTYIPVWIGLLFQTQRSRAAPIGGQLMPMPDADMPEGALVPKTERKLLGTSGITDAVNLP
jgi:hypothetical protein